MDPADSNIGVVIGGFKVETLIGKGGMGAVYRATQVRLSRPVALKILPPSVLARNPLKLERFLREAKIAAQLSHPNIVQVYDAGEEAGVFFFAMELIEGLDLKETVSREGPLGERKAIDVFLQVARALEAALEKNLIHRDVKPDNIILAPKGLVKVADFGLAREMGSAMRLTAPGVVMGTPAFMSPEQGQGEEVDHRSDLYSLGATMFYALTGRVPYPGDNPAKVIHSHVHAPVPDPRDTAPWVSEAMSRIVRRLMAKLPGGRYQSVSALIPDLEGARAGPPPGMASGVSVSSAGDTVEPSAPRQIDVLATLSPEEPVNAPGRQRPPTLEIPVEVLEKKEEGSERLSMETMDEEGGGGRRVFTLVPGLARGTGFDAAVLEARAGDPTRKVFLFSRETVRFGRQADAGERGGAGVKVDLVLRLLPCRSKEEDPENFQRNLTISRHHGAFKILPAEARLVCAQKGQGLAIDGVPMKPGAEAQLPESCTVSLSRGALLLKVKVFSEEKAGSFEIAGEPAGLGQSRALGMDSGGRITSVRIDRPDNAREHSYSILARWASMGEGEGDAVRIPGSGRGARIYFHRGEYFVGSGGSKLTVDGRSVPDGSLAPLSPGAVMRLGAAEVEFRLQQEEDFKRL